MVGWLAGWLLGWFLFPFGEVGFDENIGSLTYDEVVERVRRSSVGSSRPLYPSSFPFSCTVISLLLKYGAPSIQKGPFSTE